MKTAVIIKGNPLYIDGNPAAQKFYREIKAYLHEKGYQVTYDAGAEMTLPPKADLWIGHSRGADRLRFAFKRGDDIKCIAFGDAPKHGIVTVNHPDDHAFQSGSEVTDAHFTFTDKMKDAIDEADKEITKLKHHVSTESVLIKVW